MKDIPADSLIKNYFPVDYIDSFSKVMVTGQALTPEDFRNLAFSRFPKWIGWLMNFRIDCKAIRTGYSNQIYRYGLG